MVRGERRSSIPCYFRDYLRPVLYANNNRPIIEYLQQRELIKRSMTCVCDHEMSLTKRSAVLDGFIWHCSSCQRQKNIRTDSFFSIFNRVPLSNLLFFLWEWSEKAPSAQRVDRYGITSARVACKLSKCLREMCAEILIINPIPKVGGRGIIVQVDESVFRKRKYNRGRVVKERWVFGIAALEFNPPRPIFHLVHQRDRQTLERLITEHCLPRTTVQSDGWAAYQHLRQLGFRHQTVNHRVNFVNPLNGANTNTVENQWKWAKSYISSAKIRSDEALHLYLQCYMWRQWRGVPDPRGIFDRLLDDIAIVYQV